jgi:hypothetical protein
MGCYLYQYEVIFSVTSENFSLKSALLDMSIPILACFWAPFLWKIFFHSYPWEGKREGRKGMGG